MKEHPEGFWDTHETYDLFSTKAGLLAIGVPEDEIGSYEDDKKSQAHADGMIYATMTEEQAAKLIPEGIYCYGAKGKCPFWDKFVNLPNQNNGYCHYLKQGDFTKPGHDLLWDQCKCCGVKSEWPDEKPLDIAQEP